MTLRKLGDLLFVITSASLLAVIAAYSISGRSRLPAAREGTVNRDGDFPELTSPARLRRVILMLSPSCQYCDLSMRFYGRLVRTAENHRDHYEIVASSRAPREQVVAYLEKNGLAAVQVIEEPPPREAPATPTILILDGQGKVMRSWRGKLSDAQESQLLSILSEAAR